MGKVEEESGGKCHELKCWCEFKTIRYSLWWGYCLFTPFICFLPAQSLSYVWLFATLWTVILQPPLFMGFSKQEYRNGLPFTPPGDFPDPRIKPQCPALQADSLPPEPPGSPIYTTKSGKCYKATLLPHRPPPPRACSTSTAPAQTKHQPQPHTQDGLLTQGPFCFIIINVFIVNIHTHSILTATPQAMSSV